MTSYRLANGRTASDIRYDSETLQLKRQRRSNAGDNPSTRREQRSKRSAGAIRVLVTRTDMAGPNARLYAAGAVAGGYVNPRKSDVASVRFGDGDKRGIVTATQRDTFADERPPEDDNRGHFHRDSAWQRVECPHARCE